jgi:glycosyltransferase involved in cell wall biosynthesis
MIESITKIKRCEDNESHYSLLIPTWNLLDYLKICVESIRKNSYFPRQIIVIVNEGNDGTLEWIEQQKDIDYIYTPQNIGICCALNACRSMLTTEYIVYANDDMYFLPDWDKVLFDEITKIGHKSFMISSTMIEPFGNNPCCAIADYGNSPATFREEDLLRDYKSLFKEDWSGGFWPPNIMHVSCWDMVGGMSIEFSPGMASDQDLVRKLWEIGVRIFTGKGSSMVYHFGSKSTKRIKKNKGNKTFTLKWGQSGRTFLTNSLKLGNIALSELPDKKMGRFTKFNQFLKRIKYSF